MTILFDNISADDTSAEVLFNGGSKVLNVRADNFGNGTFDLEVATTNDPGKRFTKIPNACFTADGSVIIENVKVGLIFRGVFSGSSGASNVFADLV